MIKAAGRRFKARWSRVNSAEVAELRRTLPDTRLQQLASLMASARAFQWPEACPQDAQEVRERWRRLRESHAR
jgi:hypothetical protein